MPVPYTRDDGRCVRHRAGCPAAWAAGSWVFAVEAADDDGHAAVLRHRRAARRGRRPGRDRLRRAPLGPRPRDHAARPASCCWPGGSSEQRPADRDLVGQPRATGRRGVRRGGSGFTLRRHRARAGSPARRAARRLGRACCTPTTSGRRAPTGWRRPGWTASGWCCGPGAPTTRPGSCEACTDERTRALAVAAAARPTRAPTREDYLASRRGAAGHRRRGRAGRSRTPATDELVGSIALFDLKPRPGRRDRLLDAPGRPRAGRDDRGLRPGGAARVHAGRRGRARPAAAADQRGRGQRRLAPRHRGQRLRPRRPRAPRRCACGTAASSTA